MTRQSGHCFAVVDKTGADVIEPERLEEFANVVVAEIFEYPLEGPECYGFKLVFCTRYEQVHAPESDLPGTLNSRKDRRNVKLKSIDVMT